MIDSAIGYKFRDHIKETVLYEDQIVEHIETGHIAERRVFPKRMGQDQVAVDMVQKQLKLAASIEHPNLPSIYGSSTESGQFLYIQQHFEGETLELMAQRKNAQKPKDWIVVATRLVDLCKDLQFQGVAFDRLALRDIIISNRLLLISRRYPVGKTSDDVQRSSPYLSRLFESDTSGIYHSEGRFPSQACLNNLKNMLFQLGCNLRHQNLDEAREYMNERSQSSGRKTASELGIEHSIEEIILRLDRPSDPKSIRTIEDLQSALANFDVDKPEPVIQVSASTDSVRTGSGSSGDYSDLKSAPAFPGGNPMEKSMESETKAPAVPSAPSIPVKKIPEKPAAPLSEGSKMTGHDLDEDVDEDRSYLYPTSQRQSSSSEANKKASRDSNLINPDKITSGTSPNRYKEPIKIPWGIIIAVLALGVVGYSVYAVLPLLSSRENTAPVAAIAPLDSNNVPIQQFVILDATVSSDPEEDVLTYNWSLQNVEDETDYLIQNLESDRSKIQIKFFRPGTYSIQVFVFDGKLRSQAAGINLEAYRP